MTPEQKLLIDALSVAVCGQPRQLNLQVDWNQLIRLAASHSLLPLLCDGLQKADVWAEVPDSIGKMLSAVYMRAFAVDAQQEHVRKTLDDALSQARVPHIFLKGSVLKNDYPIPALRTMSDIDVLIHIEDIKEIDQIAVGLNGIANKGDGNHYNYCFPGGILVEFHPNLLHHSTPAASQINPGWQYAVVDDTGYSCALTEVGIYLNTICHLADHFLTGGVGVRFVLDVWVSRHLRKTQPDWNFVNEELRKFSLLEFTRNIEQLAECWFSGKESTPVLEELGEYIFSSGSYGNLERATLSAVSLSTGGSKVKAFWNKVFYPREELEDRYPWCKGKAWLLPAAWCARAFRAVTKHRKEIAKWSSSTAKINKQELEAYQNKLRRFGIQIN